VTNDQADNLVDTYDLAAQGFRVGEVPGACFCCSFDQLMEVLADLAHDRAPDVIIAEPVGSCTDLVATVVEPMRRFHHDRYLVGPLLVLLKPEHGRKILRRETKAGFSPKAAYIFLKQIEEADIVAINKTDKLTVAERDELVRLVQDQFPGKQILAVSARRGDGFDGVMERLDQPGPTDRRLMEVDYDTYAEGEAELGWLNCELHVRGKDTPFSLDRVVGAMVDELGNRLGAVHAETAHVKVLGQYERAVSIANLVANGADVETSRESHVEVPSAQLILNARVAIDPSQLESIVHESLASLSEAQRLEVELGPLQSFRPGRPVPTHRVTNESAT
jgi:G3E family GTPase